MDDEDDTPQVNMAVVGDEFHSLREARMSEDWPEWERAIDSELSQLREKGTWELVERPMDALPLANKWVFVRKRDKEGTITKYKARLVAKGCAQRPGFDYIETHSPVVRLESIRAILAIAEWNPAGDRLYVTARRLHRWYQSGLPITENFVWTEAVRPGMECGVRQADENQGVSETPIRSMHVYTQTQG